MTALNSTHNRPIQIWLYICAAFVFCMMIIGAITRLSESGLSMVEWRPLIGALPPLSGAEWARVFDLYKQSPEFIHHNAWMELSDFKRIFFWEWFHRLWGRLIGLVYALPLLWFALRKQIPTGYGGRLLLLLILGGAQGLMGWYMVQSGLVDRPAVSHFRLAAHLSLAFLLYGLLLWTALSLAPPRNGAQISTRQFKVHAIIALILFIPVMLWGAMTAGLDAGLVYGNEFPTMGGRLLPAEISTSAHLINQPVGVQFMHRWLAIGFVIFVLSLWGHGRKIGIKSFALNALGVVVVAQMILGVATLYSGVALPIATLHQAGALVILTVLIVVLSRTYRSSVIITGT